MAIITLLTDFGSSDGYVAAMKGVLASTAPGASVVDASHDIPPYDVRSGAWALRTYWRFFPAGTVHVAVVDPGVGSSRCALLVRADGRFLLGPDNGLFSWVYQQAGRWNAFALRSAVLRPGAMGQTFHGRDIFAYAAGLLAAGTDWRALVLGPAHKPTRFKWPGQRQRGNRLWGEVVHIDRFGNALTSIPMEALGEKTAVFIRCNNLELKRIHETYNAVPAQRPIAHPDSSGLLELSINEGNAAKSYGISIGSRVVIEFAAKVNKN